MKITYYSLFPCDDYRFLVTLTKITILYFSHFSLSMITSSTKTYQEILRSPKMRVFLVLSIAAYALIFFRLLGSFLVFESMIYVMVFFIFFHFLYLEIRKIPIKYLWIGMIILTWLEGLFIGYTHLLLVAAMLSINIGIVMLASYLQDESHNKIRFSSWWYFNVGWYIFTVFITIGYSCFVLWYFNKFPFTCADLSQASNSVIDFVAKPFKLGMDEAKDIKDNTMLFFNSDVQDLKAIKIQKLGKETTFIDKLWEYKKNFIDQALHDNTTVNRWICDYVLNAINTIYENPGFKTSVIVLMFLLLYGFVRIVFWVMTGIAFLIFKILLWSHVYHIKTVLKEVDDLE